MDREELAQKILFRTENANSYEFGKAGNRHKVYYDTVENLKAQVEALKIAGLIDDE